MNPFLSSLVEMEQTQGLRGGHFLHMKKDAQITFRITAALKKEMQNIAEQEGRSMAQICEAFLMAGSEGYKKDRAKFLQRFLTRRRPKALG
jgi:hypothetical protein